MRVRGARHTLAGLALLVLLAVTGCTGGPAQAADDGRIHAVATTGMLADIVRNIGGERVAVTQLMGAGIDPHLYRATEGDVDTLIRADILFYSGLHLESRMGQVFDQMGRSRPTLAAAEAIPQGRRLADPAYEGQPDPHVWMDVQLWMITAEAVRDALIELDPAGEAAYRANAEDYLARLAALDAYVEAEIARIPAQQRVLVTAHDAFQYYGARYGIEVFAPQGISTESEAGVDDIRRTVALLVEREIPAIFVESSVPPDIVEAIVEGARAQGHEVVIGGSLFSDAMGELGTPEGTYEGMIRHNTDVIVSALLGEE